MNSNVDWQPTATAGRLRARAHLLTNIREYFADHGAMEVETPIMSGAGNPDPEIESIRTDTGSYLRTSPEFALKRMLAAGSGDIYELGRVFRAGESGRNHAPEFTMLEWYRTGFDYHQLMEEVADLVRFCGKGKFDRWKVNTVSYQQLFLQYLDLDPFDADSRMLSDAARKSGVDDLELDKRQWLDLLISLVIQPALPATEMTLVFDFPSDQAALARVRGGTPPVAERFELYLGSTELANGYQELTDTDEQKRRFEADNVERTRRGLPVYDIDWRLVEALAHGMPECAGVALGVDRLLMAIEDCDSLSEVTTFPFTRA